MKLFRILGVSANLLSQRRDVRFAADELDAVYCTSTRQKRARIRDISATGLYLFTDDRWAPGTNLPVTVRNWRILEETPQSALRLRASVIRHGKDGVALQFSHADSNAAAWAAVAGMENPAALRDGLAMLRFTRALSFLYRISPAHKTENFQLIQDELAFESSEGAIETLLAAEEFTSRRGFAPRPEVSFAVIRRLLHQSSRSSDAWVRRYWAGLLAAAVPYGADDFKTMAHADLLSRLDSVHLRIVTASCTRAGYKWDSAGVISPQRFVCTADELKRITRIGDLGQNERCLDRLVQLGLLEQSMKADPFAPLCEVNLTPTRAALALFAECNGWPERARASELATEMDSGSGELESEFQSHSQPESQPVNF